jgi:UDP-glucose:(heptosyl)LPS alpha-1,3-glucosyltransferase
MADAFVLPTFYEAWGMVIIEAMASGLPVLTSRNAGAAEAVKVGFNGWLLDDPADPNEVMRGCLRLRAGLECGAEAISASVDAYQWGRIFERYEAVLRSVAQ